MFKRQRYVVHCLQGPCRLEVLLYRRLCWDGLVEDVLLELPECLLVLLPLQSLVLLEVHAVREDEVNTPVVVLVVVVLVGDAVYALQLVGAPSGYDNLVRVLVAVPLDPRQLPDATEEDLIKDNGVVGLSLITTLRCRRK